MSQPSKPQQGRRIRALSDSFHKTTKYALRPLEGVQFSGFFQGLGEEYVEVLYDGYLQALHRARVLAEADFQHVCEQHGLHDKLYALEKLCEEQGITDDGGAASSGSGQQRLAPPSRAAALAEAQRQEIQELQQTLAKVKENLASLEAQRAERQQQVQALLHKARAIAAANQQLHEASKAWCSRQVEAAS